MGSYSLPWDDLDNPNPLELNAWVYFREDTHYAWQIFEFSITQYVRIEVVGQLNQQRGINS
jgi:hypothetical protein